MSAKKKLLILGVGRAQLDAIDCAQSMGCEVYAIANSSEGRGARKADHFAVIDIVDRQAVLAHAKQIGCQAIYSVGSDIAMPTVAYVAQELGLPCPVSFECATLLNNKGRLRQRMRESGLPTVGFQLLSCGESALADTRLPAVVKPVDSQGARGVSVVRDAAELSAKVEAASSYSRSGQVIVEDYIDGPEFSINMFLVDGQLRLAVHSDRYVDPKHPYTVVTGHGIPARIPEKIASQATELAKGVLQAVQLHNGPAYAQFKYDERGAHLIEATPRLDGCHLWRPIQAMYGFNLLEAALQLVLGDAPSAPESLQPRYRQVRLDFALQEPGSAFASKHYAQDRALYRESFYEEGALVRSVNGDPAQVAYSIHSDGQDSA